MAEHSVSHLVLSLARCICSLPGKTHYSWSHRTAPTVLQYCGRGRQSCMLLPHSSLTLCPPKSVPNSLRLLYFVSFSLSPGRPTPSAQSHLEELSADDRWQQQGLCSGKRRTKLEKLSAQKSSLHTSMQSCQDVLWQRWKKNNYQLSRFTGSKGADMLENENNSNKANKQPSREHARDAAAFTSCLLRAGCLQKRAQ